MDGEAEGEGGFVDEFGVAAAAVDAEHGAGVALEEDLEVGDAGVAAGQGGEDAALVGQDGEASALFGEESGGGLGGDVVGDQGRHDRDFDGLGGHGGVAGFGHRLGAVGGSALAATAAARSATARAVEAAISASTICGAGPVGEGAFGEQEWLGHGGEHWGLAGAGWEGDDGEDVHRFPPGAADDDLGLAAGGGGQGGEGDAAGEVGRGLGELGDGRYLVGHPAGQHVDGERWQVPSPGQRDRWFPGFGDRVAVGMVLLDVAAGVEAVQDPIR